VAGAVAVAAASGAVAVAKEPLNRSDFLEQIAFDVRPFDKGRQLGTAILSLRECLDADPKAAYNYLRAHYIPKWEGWEGIPPDVTSTVLWALYAFLRSPGDYMEVIRTAIVVGGDVDSTAGIAGALAGAALGVEGLPGELLNLLSDRGGWTAEELAALAVEACRTAFPGS
jgi:ADP-ribosylglycohydrolase